MTTRSRNLEFEASSPHEAWPYEALGTLIERGTIGDWARLSRAIREDPWGPVSQQVQDYLSYEEPYGVGPLLARAIVRHRTQAEQSERAEVAREIGALVTTSGLPMAELATRLGTSRSRLSTYRSGAVTPSAAFLVRLRRLIAYLTDSCRRPGSAAAPRP